MKATLTKFYQDYMPFLASLMVHVGIICIGVATYQAVKQIRMVSQTQTIPIESEDLLYEPDINKPIGHVGPGNDPSKKWGQLEDMDVPPDAHGYGKDYVPPNVMAFMTKGVGVDDNSIIGIGTNWQLGHTRGTKSGEPDGPLGLKPYGDPNGGGGRLSFIGDPDPTFVRNYDTIVFVCDATGSMMENFDNLRQQLRRTILQLKPTQRFNVVLMQEHMPPPVDKNALRATPANKRRVFEFIEQTTPHGLTDPIPALKAALAMKPNVIFFLCDPGDFPDPRAVVDLCASSNPGRKIRINTIAFQDNDEKATLKNIAEASGGSFRIVTAKDLEN